VIAQVAWWQRETVMITGPPAATLCASREQIGCVSRRPRDIDGLQIENSGLRPSDGSPSWN